MFNFFCVTLVVTDLSYVPVFLNFAEIFISYGMRSCRMSSISDQFLPLLIHQDWIYYSYLSFLDQRSNELSFSNTVPTLYLTTPSRMRPPDACISSVLHKSTGTPFASCNYHVHQINKLSKCECQISVWGSSPTWNSSVWVEWSSVNRCFSLMCKPQTQWLTWEVDG